MSGFPKTSGSYKPQRPATLKAAYDALVAAAGGLVRAGEILGLSKSQVGRITDPDSSNARSHFSAPQVRQLQAATGCMAVTEFLASEQGYVLFRPELGEAPPALPVEVARIAAKSAKLFEEFALAMADGTLDAHEAERMLAAGDGMLAAYMRLRPLLLAHQPGRG